MAQLVLLAPGAAMPAKNLIELPTELLEHILFRLPLAHDIALAGLTCRTLCDAAKHRPHRLPRPRSVSESARDFRALRRRSTPGALRA